jgi:hypothetical protein
VASAIDPTKPVDGVPAIKADLRSNLQSAKDEIEALQAGKASLGHQHGLADIADAGALAGKNSIAAADIEDNAVTTAKIAGAAVVESKVADAAVTQSKIVDGAITESKIAGAAVTESKIAGAAVTQSKIADAAITQSKIAGAAVIESKIADAAITQSKIADAAITQSKIADAAITQSKIAADAVGATQLQDGIPISMQGALLSGAELIDYAETSPTAAISAGALTLNLDTGSVFDVVLSANLTSLILANPPATGRAGSATLILRQDATGGRTVAWPSSVLWSGGTAPLVTPAANAVDIYAFITRNGGATWFGFPGGQDFS